MPRVKQFNEDLILDKAINLFWKQGYHATSMQDLVSYLGINRASMYDTFGGKKALFDKALDRYRLSGIQSMRLMLDKTYSVKDDIRNLFCAAVEESLNDDDNKGCFIVNTAAELIPEDQELQKSLQAHRETIQKIFQASLSRGIASGELAEDKDIEALSGLLFTFYNGIKVVSKMHRDRKSLMKEIETALKLLD